MAVGLAFDGRLDLPNPLCKRIQNAFMLFGGSAMRHLVKFVIVLVAAFSAVAAGADAQTNGATVTPSAANQPISEVTEQLCSLVAKQKSEDTLPIRTQAAQRLVKSIDDYTRHLTGCQSGGLSYSRCVRIADQAKRDTFGVESPQYKAWLTIRDVSPQDLAIDRAGAQAIVDEASNLERQNEQDFLTAFKRIAQGLPKPSFDPTALELATTFINDFSDGFQESRTVAGAQQTSGARPAQRAINALNNLARPSQKLIYALTSMRELGSPGAACKDGSYLSSSTSRYKLFAVWPANGLPYDTSSKTPVLIGNLVILENGADLRSLKAHQIVELAAASAWQLNPTDRMFDLQTGALRTPNPQGWTQELINSWNVADNEAANIFDGLSNVCLTPLTRCSASWGRVGSGCQCITTSESQVNGVTSRGGAIFGRQTTQTPSSGTLQQIPCSAIRIAKYRRFCESRR